jgi:nucleoside-diphosphate kinase
MALPERTLVILKPDAVARRLVGEILGRFERKGFKVAALKMRTLDRKVLAVHYSAHREKPFYPSLLDFMTRGPVVLVVIEGPGAIAVVRKMMGKTMAHEAEPGTIRGDLGLSGQYNLIHGSDSPEAAVKEIDLFFRPEELSGCSLPDESWTGVE